MKEQVWFDSEEEFLRKIETQANLYNKHYLKEYTYYNGLSSKFNIPILIISSVNALTAISLGSFVPQELVSILNAVLSAGTGVLGSIQLYMKLNEKMTNALRSSINMKKLALKISKELTVARELRVTEGQTFLQESFSEFNTALEAGNPVEVKIPNHLAFTDSDLRSNKIRSIADVISNGSTQKVSRLKGILAKIALGSTGTFQTESDLPNRRRSPDSPPSSGESSPLGEP
jgi:hypothetical protein